MVMISNYYDATNLVRESESESCGDGEYIVSSDSDSGSDRNPLGLYTRADDEVCVSQYLSLPFYFVSCLGILLSLGLNGSDSVSGAER